MTVLVPDVGEGRLLRIMLNNVSQENQTLKLYSNNITPAETDTAGTYTECSGSGYASKALTGASWSFTEGAPTYAQYAAQTFTFSGALGNVYGAYVVGTTSGVLLWADRFSGAPINIAASGDAITYTPYIELA